MHHYGSTLHLHSLKIFITDREGFNGIQSKSKIHMKQGYFFASCADSCNSPEQTHVVSIRQLAINQYSGVEDLSKGRDEFCISAVANKGNMLAKNTSKYNDHHWHIISSQCFFFVFLFFARFKCAHSQHTMLVVYICCQDHIFNVPALLSILL